MAKNIKIKTFFYPIIVLLLFYSCNTYVSMPPTTGAFNNTPNNHKFEDFPNEYVTADFYHETFLEGGYRIGKIGVDSFKEGKWLSGNANFDKYGNVIAEEIRWFIMKANLVFLVVVLIAFLVISLFEIF